jgi:hypothetical protein
MRSIAFGCGGMVPVGIGVLVAVVAYTAVTIGVFGLLGVVQKLVERL